MYVHEDNQRTLASGLSPEYTDKHTLYMITFYASAYMYVSFIHCEIFDIKIECRHVLLFILLLCWLLRINN